MESWRLKEWGRGALWIVLLLVAFKFFTWDLPILTGYVIIDGPDPNRPGHMIGVGVTPCELLIEIAIVVFCILGIRKLQPGK
jgi:hypothetical protein